MHRSSTVTLGLLFASVSVFALSDQAVGQANRMITLTDGRSMDNFDKVGDANWRSAERALAADLGMGGFLVTKQKYGDFKLRAEVWPEQNANSGIFIRCEDPAKPSAVTCYEINIYDNNPNKGNATGAIVNVAKVDRVPQTEEKWNVIEIEARGPQLNVSVNGERTASIRDTKHTAAGSIALQYGGGVVYFRKVEIQPLTADDISNEYSPMYANCQAGFAVIFPGQPQTRDVRYTTSFGTNLPAREFYIDKGGNHFSVTVVDLPMGPYADRQLLSQALEELSKKGQVRTRADVELGLGRPGGQLNIVEPNGRQFRGSVYAAQHRLTITQAEAAMGDSEALQFEQSIGIINGAGTDVDRLPGTDPARTYDCR